MVGVLAYKFLLFCIIGAQAFSKLIKGMTEGLFFPHQIDHETIQQLFLSKKLEIAARNSGVAPRWNNPCMPIRAGV